MDEVLAALRRLSAEGRRAALATVVHVTGSTYRREGARMLVDDEGRMVGTISGGCLEGDVLEVARRVMERGRPELVRYDLTADDDAVWGLGIGCNGTVDVYVEPVGAGAPPHLDHGEGLAVATVVASADPARTPVGARLRVFPGHAEGGLGDPALDRAVAEDARDLARRGVSRTYGYRVGGDGRVVVLRERQAVLAAGPEVTRVYVEVAARPPYLMVFGAGHDAIPLVRLARNLGFRVAVVDSRPAFLTPERFPEADERVLAHPGEVGERVPVPAGAYAVVMTHNFNHDRDLLRVLLRRPLAYLGVLGPRERTERILAELAREGLRVDDARRAALHAPVGLDIGAEGPEEIAVAVMAEILAVRGGRPGGFLRLRAGPIHPEWRTA